MKGRGDEGGQVFERGWGTQLLPSQARTLGPRGAKLPPHGHPASLSSLFSVCLSVSFSLSLVSPLSASVSVSLPLPLFSSFSFCISLLLCLSLFSCQSVCFSLCVYLCLSLSPVSTPHHLQTHFPLAAVALCPEPSGPAGECPAPPPPAVS